jgi:hypothetical protein
LVLGALPGPTVDPAVARRFEALRLGLDPDASTWDEGDDHEARDDDPHGDGLDRSLLNLPIGSRGGGEEESP